LTINRTQNIKINSTRGFSLLELLIYIAILSGLVVITSDAFIMLAKGRGQAEARSEVNSTIRFVAERIKQDIKNASAVGTPSSSLSVTVSGVPVVYDVVGGALRRTENGVVATTTGNSVLVEAPTFTRLENYNVAQNATTTSIQVQMMMRYNASSTDWTYSDSFRTTISLR